MSLPTGRKIQQTCAVLCADVVGYTKLCERDEEWIHNELVKRFSIFRKIILDNSGRIVRTRGDSILVTFNNIKQALYCAIEMHETSADLNLDLCLDNQVIFRIGLNYGELIFDEGEPYGKAVNTAIRIQEIAKPGEIYISNTIHEFIKDYHPFESKYICSINDTSSNVTSVYSVRYSTKNSYINNNHSSKSIFYKYFKKRSAYSTGALVSFLFILLVGTAYINDHNKHEYSKFNQKVSEINSPQDTIGQTLSVMNLDTVKLESPIVEHSDLLQNKEMYIHFFNPLEEYDLTSKFSLHDDMYRQISKVNELISKYESLIKEHKEVNKYSDANFINTIGETKPKKGSNEKVTNLIPNDDSASKQKLATSIDDFDAAHDYESAKIEAISNILNTDLSLVEIYIDVELEPAPHVTGRDAERVGKWINDKLSKYITTYASINNLEPMIHTGVNKNNSTCKSNAHENKKLIINAHLYANAYWWHMLEVNIQDCNTSKTITAVIRGLIPKPSYSTTSTPWISVELDQNLESLIHTSISSLDSDISDA